MLARTLFERPAPGSLVARGREVIVVGAGDAGQLVLRELQKSRTMTPIGLVDDDPRKRRMRLHGVRVLGTIDELPRILRDNDPDEVLIAIPSAPGEVRQRVVGIAQAAGVPVKTLPGLYELLEGDLDLTGQIRPVQVEDLLGRQPVEVDVEAIARYVEGKAVLVTGAGGSIGSELCRQIARAHPTRIVLLEQSESALYDIERELARRARLLGGRARARRREEPREDAAGLRALPARRRLPRRGVQARAADGGEPGRVRAEQRPRHPHRRRGRDRVRGRALRPHLDRQGRSTRTPSTASRRRSASGSSPRTGPRTWRRGSSPCASATSSTRPAR